MSFGKIFRKLFIKTTDFTHGFQEKPRKSLLSFYKLWSLCYDFSVKLDPAYPREMKRMIDSVVKQGDVVLDIGCGTGLGTIHASKIAKKVIGIDLSPDMTDKLKKKIHHKKIENIEIIVGSFPESLPQEAKFDSVISSFTIVHFPIEQRGIIYEHIFNHIVSNGRIGLFSAQGEVGSTFETKPEIIKNLKSVGFQKLEIEDVFDIYRIVRADKP
ncbi:MAG: class I SAM-dependent methyltransferase [Candidatus Lokiarchaeia archaeon]